MAQSERERARERVANWRTAGLLWAGVVVASASLTAVLEDLSWWFVVILFAGLVLSAPAIARSFTKRWWVPPIAGVGTFIALLTLFFVPRTAVLGIIPTVETFESLGELLTLAQQSIQTQGVPANAVQPIVYVLCLGIGLIAIAMDCFTFWVKVPALAGIPLLVLILVPSIIDSRINDPFFFALTALAYLALLLSTARQPATRTAAALTVVAIVGALIVPAALPAVTPTGSNNGPSDAVTTGVNPIINLGNDLRRANPTEALTYVTDAGSGLYLKLSTLEDFAGREWQPTSVEADPDNSVEEFGPPPGLTTAVVSTAVVTEVSVGNILGRWLPVPYPATSIDGLRGEWAWEPNGLAVRSETANMRGQEYEVQSQRLRPTEDQLIAAGTVLPDGMELYLGVPEDLPEIVGATAAQVVGTASSNFQKAMALQAYFTGGQFEYSEEAPVELGYDGSGAEILGEFLETKAGYCVHFASAMAAMARTLDIPSRVVVGFTPGSEVTNEAGQIVEYRVTTDDLHAWPELFFEGVGWVQFEPTPGRGIAPDFSPPPVDDPATPDVDESIPNPTTTRTPTSTPTGLPIDEEEAPGAAAVGSGGGINPWTFVAAAGVLLVLLSPLAVREAQRQRRLAIVVKGESVVPAWEEIRATVRDLGDVASDTATPRMLAADLRSVLVGSDLEALDRLRQAVEQESFAAHRSEATASDVRRVVSGLRRSYSRRERFMATFLPRSVFGSWWPTPVPEPI